jgi:hypothetical protein
MRRSMRPTFPEDRVLVTVAAEFREPASAAARAILPER